MFNLQQRCAWALEVWWVGVVTFTTEALDQVHFYLNWSDEDFTVAVGSGTKSSPSKFSVAQVAILWCWEYLTGSCLAHVKHACCTLPWIKRDTCSFNFIVFLSDIYDLVALQRSSFGELKSSQKRSNPLYKWFPIHYEQGLQSQPLH